MEAKKTAKAAATGLIFLVDVWMGAKSYFV
jgi:hypothetical protein